MRMNGYAMSNVLRLLRLLGSIHDDAWYDAW